MPSLRTRVEAAVLRSALALPELGQRVLAGRPVVIDGLRLSTEQQLMLRLQRLGNQPPMGELPLERSRALVLAQAAAAGGRQPIGAVRELVVDGADGPRDARLYVPSSRVGVRGVPTLLYFHGGGQALGSLESHDRACRHLAEHSGVQVLSVDYRQPPEHRFPAGVDDCFAAYQWLVKHADTIDADPERLAVGGDSAGGNLAAVTAIRAAEAGLDVALQFLVYPVTDYVHRSRSRELFDGGRFFLSRTGMDRLSDWYFAPGADRSDPSASPLLRDDFPPGLAPAHVVTAGFDPLRDEGKAYADLLAEHGVRVTHKEYPSMIHAFMNVVGVGEETRRNNRDIAATLGQLLG
ncbi:MAG TPA: alpha/beta hydrolase [Marmoricola sp.]|nr:alpha/beta hydrolase [Marmoricola sp.]